MKVWQAIELRRQCGGSTTVDEIVALVQGDKIHQCPACHGKGFVDKVSTMFLKTQKVPCELCHGEGYTKQKYRPHMVQNGWEPDEERSAK